jgi:hypothetical protein
MNRYKLTDATIEAAIKFLKKKSDTGPAFAVRFKDDLKVQGKQLLYKGTIVVSKEKVGDVLREEIYKKNATVPASRDAAFHLLKNKYTGITRRALMKWLLAQKTLGTTRPAPAAAKRSAGEKMKKYTFETDLIFLKRTDIVKADPKFKKKSKDDVPDLSYFVSTCEKVTGLCRLDPVKEKDAVVVTPIVKRQINEMCKVLKTSPKNCALRSDQGGEFNHKELGKLVGSTLYVAMGPHIENKNRQAQTKFFRTLRARKSDSIADCMKQSEILLNQTYNRIHKGTPNELVSRDKDDNIKTFNDTRKEYVQGDKRKELNVGDHVRILVKKAKTGLDYKSYKNMTFTERVYIIKSTTKKAVPKKYRVHGKWYLIDSLWKTEPRDEKTAALLLTREVANELKAEEKEAAQKIKREKEVVADNARKEALVASGVMRRTRRGAQKAARARIKRMLQQEEDDIKKEIEEDRDDEDDEQEKKKRAMIKKKMQKKKKQQLADWDLKQLQSFAKARKLTVSGTKEQLKRRIKLHMKYKNKQ